MNWPWIFHWKKYLLCIEATAVTMPFDNAYFVVFVYYSLLQLCLFTWNVQICQCWLVSNQFNANQMKFHHDVIESGIRWYRVSLQLAFLYLYWIALNCMILWFCRIPHVKPSKIFFYFIRCLPVVVVEMHQHWYG